MLRSAAKCSPRSSSRYWPGSAGARSSRSTFTRGSGTTTLCGRNAVQLTHAQSAGAVDLGAIGERLRKHGKVVLSDFMLRADIADGGKPYSLSVFPDGRAIVHGTAEASVARSLYAKYVGL